MGQDDGAIVVEGGTASSAAALLEGTCETFAIDCGFCAKHIFFTFVLRVGLCTAEKHCEYKHREGGVGDLCEICTGANSVQGALCNCASM